MIKYVCRMAMLMCMSTQLIYSMNVNPPRIENTASSSDAVMLGNNSVHDCGYKGCVYESKQPKRVADHRRLCITKTVEEREEISKTHARRKSSRIQSRNRIQSQNQDILKIREKTKCPNAGCTYAGYLKVHKEICKRNTIEQRKEACEKYGKVTKSRQERKNNPSLRDKQQCPYEGCPYQGYVGALKKHTVACGDRTVVQRREHFARIQAKLKTQAANALLAIDYGESDNDGKYACPNADAGCKHRARKNDLRLHTSICDVRTHAQRIAMFDTAAKRRKTIGQEAEGNAN